ncbi:MAG TPA: hypothetical protein VGL86_09050 [Polyangia bacterium]|jgi:hypothetical protein
MKYLTLSLGLVAAGCNFSVAGDKGAGADDLAMTSSDDFGAADLGGGDDLTPPADLALPIICSAGSSSCSGNTLVTCPDGTAQNMTACALGCSTTGGPHCEVMVPRLPVTPTDFDTTGLTAIQFATAGGVGIGTDNGLIGAANAPLRHANTDPNTYEVHDGIGFHVVAIPGQTTKLGIYTFKSLTVPQGQSLAAYGTNGLAIVAASDSSIIGSVDVTCAANVFLGGAGKPYLSGPGGGNGGQPGATNDGVSVVAGGGGSGADNTHQAGGGGGAYGDAGGSGGDEGANRGAAGGAMDGDALQTLLVGGSGGGAGGEGGVAVGSFGGGGGGIALIVVEGTLTIGGGTMLGGVNAGGCGGTAATSVGGGGGGAGGAIFLQALTVHVATMGGVAANGAGGGASNATGATANGKGGAISTTAAAGGSGGSAPGGVGGVVGATGGGNGGNNGMAGGGGGGAVGRIRIESQSGAATIDGLQSPTAAQGTVDIH